MAASARTVLARRLCLGLGGSLALAFALVAWTIDYAVEREIWLLRATGYTALGALFASLTAAAVRGAAEVVGNSGALPLLPALRRALGMMSAWFALAHGGLALTTYLWGSWPAVVSRPYLRAGLVTLAILTALLATSFPRWVRALGIRHWKALHRLAYAAALFLFQHLLLSPFADKTLVLWLFGGLIGLACLRLGPFLLRRRRAGGPAPGSAGI